MDSENKRHRLFEIKGPSNGQSFRKEQLPYFKSRNLQKYKKFDLLQFR